MKHLCDFDLKGDHSALHFGSENDVLFMFNNGGEMRYYNYDTSENNYKWAWKRTTPSDIQPWMTSHATQFLASRSKFIIHFRIRQKTNIYSTDFELESDGTVYADELLAVSSDRLIYKNFDVNTFMLNVYSLDFKFLFSLTQPDGKKWNLRTYVCVVPDSDNIIVYEYHGSNLHVFSSVGKLSYQYFLLNLSEKSQT